MVSEPSMNRFLRPGLVKKGYHEVLSFLGGGFNHFLFSPLFGEDFHFDSYFFRGVETPTSLSFLANETTVYFTRRSSWCKSCGSNGVSATPKGWWNLNPRYRWFALGPPLTLNMMILQKKLPKLLSPPKKAIVIVWDYNNLLIFEPFGPWLISIHHSIIHVGPFPPQTQVLNITFPVAVAMRFVRGAGYSWVSDDVWWRVEFVSSL